MDRQDSLALGATGCKPVKRPRRNRVTPFGTIEATPHRGTLMGNRGDLHAADGTLGRQWRSNRWISCVLDAGDGWRVPMDEPGRNYPLFFSDEAVALAAGHRPCGECRPGALSAFITAWKVAIGMKQNEWISLRQIDRQLHAARLMKMERSNLVEIDALPDGVFVWWPNLGRTPFLKIGSNLHPWSHEGYGCKIPAMASQELAHLLTPMPLVELIRSGYPILGLENLQPVATRQRIDPRPDINTDN